MAKQRKGLYEGMYILSATLSNDSRKKAFDKITDGIAEKGGEILKIHDMGRRKLCYEVKGKKEGHYYLVYFSLPTQAVIDLWKDYHLHEDLLRFMTMKSEAVLESLDYNPIRVQG